MSEALQTDMVPPPAQARTPVPAHNPAHNSAHNPARIQVHTQVRTQARTSTPPQLPAVSLSAQQALLQQPLLSVYCG